MWSGPKQSVDVGSLPAPPPHWVWSRLGAVASIRARIGWKALTASEYLDDGYVFLATPNIKSPKIDFENVNFISDFRYRESPELQLQMGDVLLAKDGNTLGITNVVRHLPRPATVNGSIAVIRPSNIDGQFLTYYLASSLAQGMMQLLRGGMGVPHLFQSDLRKLPVAVPPRAQQFDIVRFLDLETARIDALMAAKRRLIDLLVDRIRLLGRELTCVGPACPLRRVLLSVKTGGTPPTDSPEYYVDATVPWYSPGDFGDLLDLQPPARSLSFRAVSEGQAPSFLADSTLLVGIGATSGRVAHLDHEASGNQQLTCVRTTSGLLGRFLSWQLWARTDELRGTAPYTTLPIISNEFLKSVTVSVPDLSVQATVVSRLDATSIVVAGLRNALEHQADLLAERRRAIVTAAVTRGIRIQGLVA